MANLGADRNLLFGVLAVQLEFIRGEQLIAAMNRWVLEKSQRLGDILVRDGQLSGERCALLEALVNEHLRQHAGDPERSLAALSSLGAVRHALRQLNDPDLNASMAHLPEPQRAPSRPVGAATGTGQRFRILRPHARGGLGQISVACDEELHRDVALKELQEQLADDPESRARFVREAEITGNLEHPGVVPVYGLGQYADGRPFYAMRFIRGDSLKEAIEQYHRTEAALGIPPSGSLELRKLLGRFIDVCNAVEYAHSRGVLHRDLKPGNIMLGKYGETLVVDWGLAKPTGQREEAPDSSERAVRPQSVDGSTPTRLGTAIGTPAFMSPEQAAGRIDALGTASDVYSLGATLYCLLTGRPPIVDDDLTSALHRVEWGRFPRPRAVKAGIPAALEAVCLKAMALEPKDRYGSPSQLAEDLEHWLADEPVTACREPLTARLRRWGRHHKTAVASLFVLLITVVIAACIGAALLGEANRRIQRERDVANSNAAEARRQRDLANRAAAEALQGRGLSLLAEGDRSAGMHWLARGVQAASPSARDMLRVSRRNLAAWSRQILPMAAEREVPRYLECGQLSDRGPTALQLAGDFDAMSPPAENRRGAASGFEQLDSLEMNAWIQLLDSATLDFAGPPLQPEGEWWSAAFDAGESLLCSAEVASDAPATPPPLTDETPTGQTLRAVFTELGDEGQSLLFDGELLLRRRKLPTGEPLGPPLRLRGTFLSDVHDAKHQASVTYRAQSDAVLCYDYAKAAAQLWSLSSGKPISEPVVCMRAAVSDNGRVWATVDREQTITIRDAVKKRPLGEPLRHKAAIQTLSFNSSGELLEVATADNEAHIWMANSGRKLTTIRHTLGRLRSIETRPYGGAWLLVDETGQVELWRLDPPPKTAPAASAGPRNEHTCHLERRSASPGVGDFEARFTRDGQWALLRDSFHVVIWSNGRSLEYQEIHAVSREGNQLINMALDEPHRRIAIVSPNGDVRILSDDDDPITLRHATPAVEAQFSGDGATLATCDALGVIRLWNVERTALVGITFGVAPGRVRQLVSVNRAGDRVAAVEAPKNYTLGHAVMRIWRPPTGEAAAREVKMFGQRRFALAPRGDTIAVGDFQTHAATFSPDGRLLIVPDAKNGLRVINTTTGQPAREPLHTTDDARDIPPTQLVVTPDSKRIVVIRHGRMESDVTVTNSGPLRAQLWDLATGKPAGPLIRVEDASQAVALDAGRTRIAVGATWPLSDLQGQLEGSELRFHIWDLATGQPVGRYLSHRGEITALAFAPDSAIVVSGATDQTARLWDARNGTPVGTRMEHEGAVTSAFFLNQGRILLTVSENAWRTWEIPSCRPILPPVRVPNTGGVVAAVSHDGSRLATAGDAGGQGATLQEWDTATGQPIGPPHDANESIIHIAYDAASRHIIASTTGALRVSPIFDQVGGGADQLVPWVRSITGMDMDELGSLRPLTPQKRAAARDSLIGLADIEVQPGPTPEVWNLEKLDASAPGQWPPRW